MAARYYQQNIAQYNPLSMEEMMFAPMQMRQRHDLMDQGLSEIGTSLGQFDVLSDYGPAAQQIINPVQQELESLATDLATRGYDHTKMSKLMKLKSQREGLFNPTGEIGQLQGATQKYRDQVKQIQEQFKDSPELVSGALQKLKAGEAVIGEDGKLSLSGMQTPSLYRHIKDEDIMKQLNDAVSTLKPSDFKDLGITGLQKAGSFDDLITTATQEGVAPERILALMSSVMGPEAQNSILQYNELVNGIPRDAVVDIELPNGKTKQVPAGLESFFNRMEGVAMSRAYTDTNVQRFMRKDDLGLHNAKKAVDEELETPYIGQGGNINVDVVNPFSQLKVDNKGNVVSDEKLNKEYWKDKGGYNVVEKPDGTWSVFLKKGDNTNPVFESSNNSSVLQGIASEQFRNIKNKNPELAKLSDNDALKRINEDYERYTKQYGKTEKVSLSNPNFVNTVLSGASTQGVYGENGKLMDFNKMLKDQKYEDYNDYISKNKNGYLGYRKFGPKGRPVHEFRLSDNTSFFVEAEDNIQQLSARSTEFNQMIMQGALASPEGFSDHNVITSEGFVNTKEIKINPMGSGQEPYKLDIVLKDERINPNDIILPYIQGLPQEQVKKALSNMGYEYNKDFRIQTLSNINRSENDNINQSLKYMRK